MKKRSAVIFLLSVAGSAAVGLSQQDRTELRSTDAVKEEELWNNREAVRDRVEQLARHLELTVQVRDDLIAKDDGSKAGGVRINVLSLVLLRDKALLCANTAQAAQNLRWSLNIDIARKRDLTEARKLKAQVVERRCEEQAEQVLTLMDERDALPSNSPRRRQLDAEIAGTEGILSEHIALRDQLSGRADEIHQQIDRQEAELADLATVERHVEQLADRGVAELERIEVNVGDLADAAESDRLRMDRDVLRQSLVLIQNAPSPKFGVATANPLVMDGVPATAPAVESQQVMPRERPAAVDKELEKARARRRAKEIGTPLTQSKSETRP